MIQRIATSVVDAACIAFPPSSVILAAFTFVMTASKHVSDDYDMIESFFNIMQAFLRRLSLLENQIPKEDAFQKSLVEVFSSLLNLSGIARTYCAKGRLKKWARDLVDGADPELTAAYAKLNGDLSHLESTVIMQILRSTIESSAQTKLANENIRAVYGLVEQNSYVTKQSLESSEQTRIIVSRNETVLQEVHHMSRDSAKANSEFLRILNEMKSKDEKSKERNMKSGASKPENFNRLKRNFLRNDAEGGLRERLENIKLSYVGPVFDWIQVEPAFQSIIDEKTSLLCVSGASGMGKSTLSFVMLRYLEQRFASVPTTSVAWFSFDEEHPDMRSIGNMLRCCAIRAAAEDTLYCRDIYEALRRRGGLDADEDEDAWEYLIESRYTAKSDRRMIIILDGIDQVTEGKFATLVELLGRIKRDEAAVQVIFTCDKEKEESLSILEAKTISLTREKIIGDLSRFASWKTKSLSRLRNLRKPIRKRIVQKMMQKADSFLYVEHTMRRLNALGRETLVVKELGNLADNTEAIHRTLLEECQKNRTAEDRELLRNLLAWLAYTKARFTIAEANLLIGIMQNENALSIEEELDGRLSRLLRISGYRASGEPDESSTDEDNTEIINEADPDTDEKIEEANTFLGFQERSLKAYFRREIQDQAVGLRCTAAEAQVIVFQTCSAILTMPKKNEELVSSSLERYAAQWVFSHLRDIPTAQKDKVDDTLAGMVLQSIHNIFVSKNDALKPLEERAGDSGRILDGIDISQDATLKLLSDWAQRAQDLTPKQLPYDIQKWFRPLVHEPLRIFIGLSRTHIINWFSAKFQQDAYCAFISAHHALQEGRTLPELKQSPSLGKYFDDFARDEAKITERSFKVVANCYWDIVKTSSSYKGIGMAMRYKELYEPAIEQLTKGLDEDTITKLEQFQLLGSKAQSLLELGRKENDEQKKISWLEESLTVYDQAQSVYHDVKEAGALNEDFEFPVCWNLENMACAAALLGRSEKAVSRLKEAIETKGALSISNILELTAALKDDSQFSMIIEVLEQIDKETVARYLILDGSELAQEAAARTKRGKFLLDLYESSQKVAESWSVGHEFKARLQWNAAIFARQALGDCEVAKRLLGDMIDHPACADWRILGGCNQLAEIMLEEFRLSSTPSIKQQALEKTLALLDKPAHLLPPDDYQPTESHISVTVAIMLRRLGPSLDFHGRLNSAFKSCMDELQDDTGFNDSFALRRLARVLSCVSGFERFASIALTAQFYVLDDVVRRKDLDLYQAKDINGTQDLNGDEQPLTKDLDQRDSLQVEHDDYSDIQSVNALVDGITTDDVPMLKRPQHERRDSNEKKDIATSAPQSPMVPDEMDQGILDFWVLTCNVCRKEIPNLSHGAVYYCIYCIDCDICEDCFSKKEQRERGEVEPDWHVICPSGHKHVKAPVEGWRGIKGGMMRIAGEEIPFKNWLTQLESQWTEYWRGFWTETDML
ncbi:hypothetical protein N0V94_005484 [Neodidymelliopsis sp. IMI 364377]|nr:hypothetical protein N0V94_005484 [Neodidymelliopsis sp. IMI 364377]